MFVLEIENLQSMVWFGLYEMNNLWVHVVNRSKVVAPRETERSEQKIQTVFVLGVDSASGAY